MTYTSETVSFVSDSVKFLAERGFTTIILIPDFFDTKWTDEKFEQLTKQYYEVKKYGRYHPEVDICTGNVSYNPYKGYYGCGGGKNTFSIDVNGDIYPCTYAVEFEKFKLGDIFHWNDYKIVDYKTDHEQRKDCKGCKYFQICISGRCIFLNYKATGQFYKPGACFCEYQKLEYKYLGI